MHIFARLAPICMLSRCSLTKSLQRRAAGSLLRVRCWLGSHTRQQVWFTTFSFPDCDVGIPRARSPNFALVFSHLCVPSPLFFLFPSVFHQRPNFYISPCTAAAAAAAAAATHACISANRHRGLHARKRVVLCRSCSRRDFTSVNLWKNCDI